MKSKLDVAIESLEELEKRLNKGKFLEAKDMFKYIWDRIERAGEKDSGGPCTWSDGHE